MTGEPLARARVQAMSIPEFREGMTKPAEPRIFTAMTDAGGAFRFPALDPGNYVFTARKPEFVEEQKNPGQQSFTELRQSREDLRLRLSPLGVIEGKVIDQDGEPLRGINIVAVTTAVEDGLRVPKFSRSVSTDDRGLYRLWNLTPAKYYVKAAGRQAATSLYIGGLGADTSTSEGFDPVYFGGATAIESATPVAIDAGGRGQADLRVTMKPAHKISGRLENFVADKTVRFELFSGEEEVSAGRATVDGSTGRFEIRDVTDGNYLLRATQLAQRGEIAVSVRGTDVTGVAVTLGGGVNIRLTVAGGAQPKMMRRRGRTADDDDDDDMVPVGPAACNATLRSVGLRPTVYGANPPHQAVLRNVMPGEYRFSLQCTGGYVASVRSGDLDLKNGATIAVMPGVTPAPIDILLSSGGGTLEVSLELDQPPPQAWVLLVPQSQTSSEARLLPAWRGEKLMTRFADLAPGDYALYAFSTQDDVEFRNPAFLKTLSGGESVKVDGKDSAVTLRRLTR